MKCPHCMRPVKALATKCEHCTGDINIGQNWLATLVSYIITIALVFIFFKVIF